jgi:site-specific DNA recombinase
LESVLSEIAAIHRRLDRLYDSIETGKINIDDLAPRIHSLKQQEDQLQAARIDLEEQLAERKIALANDQLVRSYGGRPERTT